MSNLAGWLKSREDRLIYYYLLALTILLLFGVRGMPWVNDELAYLLSVDSLSKTGSPLVDNGISDFNAPELVLHGTLVVDANGRRMLMPYPSIFYPYLALPFYLLFSIPGLVLLNLMSFIASTFLVYHLSLRFFNAYDVSLTSAIVYSVLTYSVKYSLDIWPHSLSVLAVLLSSALLIRNGGGSVFAAGMISGLAVGLRYPNIIFTLVLAAYLILSNRPRQLLLFSAGAAIPLSILLWVNNSLYGTPLRTGYIDFADTEYICQLMFIPLAIPVAILSALVVKRYVDVPLLYRRHGGDMRRLLFALLVLSLVLFGNRIIYYLGFFFSLVVDFSFNPYYDEFIFTRAILQSSPILVLSFIGIHLMIRERTRRESLILLVSIPAVEILFCCVLGVFGSMSLMRYLLESIPYLSILSAYALHRLRAYVLSCPQIFALLYAPVIPLIIEAVNFAASKNLIYYTYKVPMLLSLSTLIVYYYGMGIKKVILPYLLVSIIAYSLVLNITFLSYNVLHREYLLSEAHEISEIIPDGSLVLHSRYVGQMIYIPAKVHRNLDIAFLELGNRTSNKELVDHYLDNGIQVYVVPPHNKSASFIYGMVKPNEEPYVRWILSEYEIKEEITLINDRYLFRIGR
ncbi:MAG: hypothetical protein GF416_01175 [Candidatus Altiarchaeales archaeon]|nr:hypothetical protein [Candidatus Altiarchaeales archaeon]MBD3415728.1 hypothetical protein [Candidatus Altiarchaeales archaeon]